MSPEKGALQGVLHQYAPRLAGFEHTPWHPRFYHPNEPVRLNTIVFVGGLGDTFFTVPYVPVLAASLPPTWVLLEVQLTSSGEGWRTGSLSRDVDDISQCISYVRSRRPLGKVVLMGHSTGCQDAMHYMLHGPDFNATPDKKLDAVILQAPVSDREGISMMIPKEKLTELAKDVRRWIDRGDGEEMLPSSFSTGLGPICARRWWSLVSPGPDHKGEDDYFSSDFDEDKLQQTFGKLGQSGTKLLFLYSGMDEHVPDFVDKQGLVARWTRIVRQGGGDVHKDSGVVPGATHNLTGSDHRVTMDLVKRVVSFLSSI